MPEEELTTEVIQNPHPSPSSATLASSFADSPQAMEGIYKARSGSI